MTRRIAFSILLTVWATLVVGGVTAYFTTRSVLLADLDRTLVEGALARSVFDDKSGSRFWPLSNAGDDSLVRGEFNRTLARSATQPTSSPKLLHAAFATLPGSERVRTVTVRAMAVPMGDGEPRQLDIVYRGSAAGFDRLLSRLALSLLVTGVVGGLAAALLARWVAITSLRPLQSTASVIGSIDERQLDRRIDAGNLPPELRPVAERLNDMLARLELSARQRKQFIADASHELRTPVAALIMGMEVSLRRPREVADYRSTLESCLTDARLLRNLVEALLNQVRSELSPQALRIVEVDIAGLVRECVTALAPLADNRGIRVQLDVADTLVVRTDPDRVRAILLNLIGNAIDYNRTAGSITVAASADSQGLELSVVDTGRGIAPEQLDRIFQPFHRIDAVRTDGHLGLGLYLVQTHARTLGGTCTVSSELGKGTSFRIHLPGTQVVRQAAAPAISTAAPA